MSNMRDFLHELLSDQTLKAQLTAFLKKYGKSGLRQAMQSYSDLQKQYICKSKNSISKICQHQLFQGETANQIWTRPATKI